MNDVYAIEGSQLYKEFPLVGADPIIALDHLDFKIRKGCLTALVGPDGAGKTTLIRLIAGLLDATFDSFDSRFIGCHGWFFRGPRNGCESTFTGSSR